MANWNRQYRLKFAPKSGTGYEIGEPNSQGYTLHVNFTIHREDSSSLGTAKILIYNLNKNEVNAIRKEGCSLTLSAGYGTTRPTIFDGTITNVDEYHSGADRYVSIDAVDSYNKISTTACSITYDKNTSAYKVLGDIANKLGTPVTYSQSAMAVLQKTIFNEGYSYIGYARYVLDDIASVTKLSWAINNGVLQIRKDDECIDEYVNLLSKSTGLIGFPRKIFCSDITTAFRGVPAGDTITGYQVKYLMNGAIGIGDKVKIESDTVTGVFRVTELVINGDNLEGDWTCTAKVTEVK